MSPPSSEPSASRLAHQARRYGLVLYWLVFAMYTLYAARNPGFVAPGTRVPYPWGGVLVTWAVLGVLTGILYAILRPRTFRRDWGRSTFGSPSTTYTVLPAATASTNSGRR